MYGETLGTVNGGSRSSAQSWLVGGLGRARPRSSESTNPPIASESLLGSIKQSQFESFGSAHVNVVHFAYGDGHVDAFERSVDWSVYYSAFGIADSFSR